MIKNKACECVFLCEGAMSRETLPVLLESDFLLKAIKGSYLQKGPRFFAGVSINSRPPQENKLFFALQGPRFNGHDFLE